MSAKDEQIKVLEATNSELLSGIQQRADAQVSEIRKQNAERKDLIELLEKDRDNQKKKAEKLERKLKYTEQHLRRHGLSSEMFRAG
jgi:transcriptional regulator with GAF, ATPase, and Fis domain